MPNIRLMQWNIRKFSQVKAGIPGMLRAISRTIIGADADVVVIIELTRNNPPMALLAADLRLADPGRHWAYTQSTATSTERYGFLYRDLGAVRPMGWTVNGNVRPPPGDFYGQFDNPVRDLNTLRFTTWPDNVWPIPVGGIPLRGPAPILVNPFASPRQPRQVKMARYGGFGGQPAAGGGYAPGFGSRLPCLSMLHVYSAPMNVHYYIPLVVNHLWANRSAHVRNHGARGRSASSRPCISRRNTRIRPSPPGAPV
jgi:hypothetical protein